MEGSFSLLDLSTFLECLLAYGGRARGAKPWFRDDLDLNRYLPQRQALRRTGGVLWSLRQVQVPGSAGKRELDPTVGGGGCPDGGREERGDSRCAIDWRLQTQRLQLGRGLADRLSRRRVRAGPDHLRTESGVEIDEPDGGTGNRSRGRDYPFPRRRMRSGHSGGGQGAWSAGSLRLRARRDGRHGCRDQGAPESTAGTKQLQARTRALLRLEVQRKAGPRDVGVRAAGGLERHGSR